MRKSLQVILISLTFLFAISGYACAGEECTGIDKEFLSKHVPFVLDSVIQIRTLRDLEQCQVVFSIQGQNGVAYVPFSKKYVIAGELFKEKAPLAEKVIGELDAKNTEKFTKQLDESVAVSYKPANASTYVYMVTDPDCPYCERAKEQAKRFADENSVEIRVLFFPLPMHPDARAKSARLTCSKDGFMAYLNGDYSAPACPEAEKKIDSAIDVSRKLGINGTPTFIGANGKRVSGFNAAQLKEMIKG